MEAYLQSGSFSKLLTFITYESKESYDETLAVTHPWNNICQNYPFLAQYQRWNQASFFTSISQSMAYGEEYQLAQKACEGDFSRVSMCI